MNTSGNVVPAEVNISGNLAPASSVSYTVPKIAQVILTNGYIQPVVVNSNGSIVPAMTNSSGSLVPAILNSSGQLVAAVPAVTCSCIYDWLNNHPQ